MLCEYEFIIFMGKEDLPYVNLPEWTAASCFQPLWGLGGPDWAWLGLSAGQGKQGLQPGAVGRAVAGGHTMPPPHPRQKLRAYCGGVRP